MRGSSPGLTLTKKRVFVTGGSGFIGGHVIERLAGQGHEVLAMARSEKSAEAVAKLGARAVKGDLESVQAADLERATHFVHCAARVEEWGTRAEFWAANVDGTERMLEVAKEAGVSRFVHVGTEAAIFTGRDLVDVDETFPYPEHHRYLYSETKAEAEKRVLAADRPGSFRTLSVRPRFVWGPRDATLLPEICRAAKEGRFSWIDGGRAKSSHTHVRNLCAGIDAALERGEGGRAYFVTDDEVHTFKEMLTLLCGAYGVTLGTRSTPSFVARPLASTVETLYGALGRPRSPLSRLAVDMFACNVTINTDRAREELGWAPEISFADGVEQLAEWHRSEKSSA